MQSLNTQPETPDDEVAIVEDDVSSDDRVASRPAHAYWKILVVDDDPEVHAVTQFVLGNTQLLGRPLELIEAKSSQEAQTELLRHPDIAVVLLDVVMEEHDSGLKFARWVREAGLEDVRIILRTGQPGYAPELDVIRDYDINDYRAKSELTQTRLITSMTAALRTYQQIEMIERSRRGLEMIISSCSQLFQKRELASFSHGVLLQIASLCGIDGDGMICASSSKAESTDPRVVSGVGELANYIGRNLSHLPETNELKAVTVDAMQRNVSTTDGPLVLSVETPPDRKFIASLDHHQPLDAMDSALLRVFAANIAVGFENVDLIERLDRLAYWDEPADLPNRHRLLDDMADRGSGAEDVALVRIITYSETLVAFGQAMATGLLCEIASWLRRTQDCEVYRYGEDVLGLILNSASQQESLLADLGQRQYIVKGQAMRARFAIGLAPLGYQDDVTRVSDQAYAAMALAGGDGREEIVRFDEAIIQDARNRIELTTALRSALDDGEVDIVFQPLVDMTSGTCKGFEALARWSRGDKPVSPSEFIPLAEQVGLTLKIFELGVRRSAQWLKKLQATDREGHYVSVNLAACDVEREDLVPYVVNLLGRAELPPGLLQIEITEQSLIRDFAVSERNLRALKNLGCRIAIDDFGTGYSSLSYIGGLPVDVLKLDRQFVTDITDNPSSQAIVSLTVGLANRLELEVLAEGIETAEQQAALHAMGLTNAQGFLFGRPMSPDQLIKWLSDGK